MRILRGLSSRVLPCGCLAGVYETYDATVIAILDAKDRLCADSAHEQGRPVSLDSAEVVPLDASQSDHANRRG
jgi:hypothetical protein